MLEFIEGQVVETTDNYIIVFSSGFGIKIHTPYKFPLGKVRIYTYLTFKDETFKLFGFKTKKEKELFIKLTNINGIGVKHAFSILANIPVDKLIDSIEAQNISLLMSAPGIGKKTAHRIILELKGKLNFEDEKLLKDAVSALENLGFEKSKVLPVVKEVIKNTTNIEDIIKYSLQKLTEKS
jgi:Holliday junction DNA helicase RuvA